MVVKSEGGSKLGEGNILQVNERYALAFAKILRLDTALISLVISCERYIRVLESRLFRQFVSVKILRDMQECDCACIY